MGLRIVYGKAGSGKSEFCFSEISKLLDTQENILIITPEQFSYTAEKKLMQKTKNNAVINAEVITLSRMAYRVMQEVGNKDISSLSTIPKNESVNNLTKAGKSMLVHLLIEKNKDKLKFLNKSKENVNLTIQALTEFKKHKISVDLINKNIQNIEDRYLKIKLNDMKLIYENFENYINGNLIDDNDLLFYLEQNIEKTNLIKDSIIYIDEFIGFTKQEYSVIAKLIKLAKQVTITICVDKLEPPKNSISDIFYSNKQTLYKLLNLLEENDLKLEKPIQMKELYRFKNEELKFLESNIFNIEPKLYKKDVKNIELFLAKNQYSEVENIAMKITNLIKNEKYRYNQIAIIVKNLSMYSNLIRSIFMKYEIPVFIDEKRDLNQNIIIKYILSLFEVLNKNYSYDSVINYIKSGFLEIDEDEIYNLENYCNKWQIKYNKWKNDFTYELKEKKEEIIRLNEIRKQIITPIEKLKLQLSKSKNVEEFCKEIYLFLVNQNIENKILIKRTKLEEKGLIDLSNEYKKSYEIIINLLDDIAFIFKNESFTLNKFIECFKIGLNNSSLGKIPGTQDQVIVGDIERTRSNKIKALFVLGINDGVFPSSNRDEGFFNDEDRKCLKDNELEIAKGTMENLYEENFNIYKAFSTSENKIFLSYASSDNEGKSLRPSVIIFKLKKIFPNLKESSDVINRNYEIVNCNITYEELLEKIYKLSNNEKIEPIWYMVYKYYKLLNNWSEILKNDLTGLFYTNKPKDISKENIDKLYGNILKTSVSRLEKYRSCSFSYYLQYGLNLKPKEELKVQNFNTGSFLHEIIDGFFKYSQEEKINLSVFLEDQELIEKIVSKIIEQELELSKNTIFNTTSKYKILVRRLKKIVSKALKYIIEGLVYSEFDIYGTEVEFGQNSKYRPIIVNLDNGKKVEITGKIDRIDTVKSEENKYLRIIDYKSSVKNIDLNQVYAGLQIQLLTYLDAVCKQEDLMPAGILYFSLLEQMIKSDNKITEEEIEEEIRKNFKMKGLILADVKIIKLHDKTLKNGSSKIIPAAITASGEVNKRWTSGVGQEEFKILQDYIYKTIKDISKEILKGKIDVNPYFNNGKTPCSYCPYKSICGFDLKLCNNKYNYIDKLSKDEVIAKMKEDI